MLEVGDLVKQKAPNAPFMNAIISEMFNFDSIGIVMEIITVDYLYGDLEWNTNVVVRWSNGNIEQIPLIYLELVSNE